MDLGGHYQKLVWPFKVRIHRGGYRCIHSWVWVDPEWDDELQEKFDNTKRQKDYTLSVGKNQIITVIGNKAQVKRLRNQIELQKRGFVQIRDAETNDVGFSAVHQHWHRRFTTTRNKELQREMKTEYDAGKKLAELKYEALYDIREKNNIGGGVDVILNGVPMEIKTPTKFNAKTVWNRIAKSKNKEGVYQSDDYIINLKKQMSDPDYQKLINKIKKWYVGHDDTTVYILQNFKPTTLEEVLR